MRTLCLLGFGLGMLAAAAGAAEQLLLAGDWRLRLDPGDEGMEAGWFGGGMAGATIPLPGSLQEAGFGDPISLETPWTGSTGRGDFFTAERYAPYRRPGNIKVPFWLQPDTYYKGAAWYERTIETPAGWAGRRIVLHLERPHWETRVWVDGNPAGTCDRLGVAHEYDLTSLLRPGEAQRLSIRVDNRLVVDVGINSHSVTDHTQSNWNGIVGELALIATGPVWLDDVQVYPDLAERQARVVATIGNHTGEAGAGVLHVSAESRNTADAHRTEAISVPVEWDADGGRVDCVLPFGDGMRTWDEFSPALYDLRLTLGAEDPASAPLDERTVRIGMREVGVDGTQITVNGRRTFLRGTLECAIFPLTGYPSTRIEDWTRIIRTCQAHGLNHMRFHSWCPPEAAFAAADVLGFYLQVECSSWANSGASIGEGKPLDDWLYEEARAMIRQHGNHPSFLMMAYGNEPAGRDEEYLSAWCAYWKGQDPRRLHTSGAGWPLLAESDFHSSPAPRIQAWGQGLRSIINAEPPRTDYDWGDFVRRHPDKPTISHEIGQWCVYPDFREIPKYTGVLKARNFEVFRDLLAGRHMADQAMDFLLASGKLQTLCYKADIEAALRTPGFGGFQLLDLHDFPGQGTALVGVLNAFWESKPYVSPEEFARFCNRTVPLARLPKRIFTAGESLGFDLEMAHYGAEALDGTAVWWRLEGGDGREIDGGVWEGVRIPAGGTTRVGTAAVALGSGVGAERLRLAAGVRGTPIANHWDCWVYPAPRPAQDPEAVRIVRALDEAALAHLRAGGRALWLVPPERVRTRVKLGFSSIFWNTAWTEGQAPHTLGILCDPKHPALASFPTDFHSDWQWWELVTRAATLEMDGLPPDLRPIVQVVPDWFDPMRLGLVFEAAVEDGRLLVCSIDLDSDLDSRPAARQLRHSLLAYAAGDAFAPRLALQPGQLQGLVREPTLLEQWGARVVHADSAAPGYEADRVLDGDPATIWHTAWAPAPDPMPHELVLDLGADRDLAGFVYTPRRDMTNGRVRDYQVFVSPTRQDWGSPAAAGQFPAGADAQTVRFDAPRRGRYVRLLVNSEVNGQPFASVAELGLLPAP